MTNGKQYEIIRFLIGGIWYKIMVKRVRHMYVSFLK